MSIGSLKVKISDAKGVNILPVAKSTVTVGSAPHCDVVLDHPTVQAEHVRAWLEGGRIWIQDLGTSGGTFLNGIRLPGLKPMLVRDLDVLKLGECPSSLGMEANLVRAPMVRPSPPVEENTLTMIHPVVGKDSELDKRREDLAKVSRELAELKLQLQMGRLEKSSTDEQRNKLTSLREETRLLAEQREEVDQALKALNADREMRLNLVNEEIARKLSDVEIEIKQMRDNAGRKLGHWKVDMVAELGKAMNQLTQQKARQWVTRALSQDMIFEWEAELNQIFRRILLDEESHTDTPIEITRTFAMIPLGSTPKSEAALPPIPADDDEMDRTVIAKRVVRRPKLNLKLNLQFSRAQYAGIGVLALIIGVLLLSSLTKRGSPARSVAAQGPAQPAPQAAQVAQPAPPPPAVPARFNPRQTRVFKKTYTENVLYTENYADAEFNQAYHQRWMADLAKAARDQWHVDDKTLLAVAAKELQLIQDLQRLKDGIQVTREQQGIAAMRAREAVFQGEMQTLLQGPEVVERYLALKNAFYMRNSQYLVKQTR